MCTILQFNILQRPPQIPHEYQVQLEAEPIEDHSILANCAQKKNISITVFAEKVGCAIFRKKKLNN
jgi:hypothetical protein